jgi:hypothetical protein
MPPDRWRVFQPGDKARCPYCRGSLGFLEITAGTVLQVRKRGPTTTPPSVIERCRKCEGYYEKQILPSSGRAVA